jgi:hypothetical protein
VAKKLNPIGWRIPLDLRKRINFKADNRDQTAEEFVIECMEANTIELTGVQKQIQKEHRENRPPIVVKSKHEK